ncbi:Propeptide PepSY amd peptidase M4 [Desulfotomaculum nigrificans CO-1-SRB]|uniref:Propeptide PepSY amd peptidase M4 n=1 Tax=Desulfotomaculum nigrificans (strain DSM 14880 / VKM B-2319 / CO-1-SRB) TaxID=868595 RepID=F6B7D5_DESCC|nr:YcdB/YcdC domain-containing protein [Desulfotomaculum nigrificans]AEF93385.1 Propeptide PepSY amd peptidase M4 [Desulfotomaculum nigrificans CO-1-SRB]
MRKKICGSLVTGCLVTGLILSPAAYADVQKTILPKPPVAINGDVTKAKIPLDKAVQMAKDVFNIGNDYDRFESGFNTFDGRTEWQLNWNRTKEPGGSISVRINAMTGDIVGMDRWESPPPGQQYTGLPKYSYDEGAKLAREWAQKLLPAYLTQTRPGPQPDQPFYGFGQRGPAEYYYVFQRVVNNVVYPENNIIVRINGDTGQLLSINLNWRENVTFPSTAGMISMDQARQVFKENVEQVYFRPSIYGAKDVPIKLVYWVKKGPDLFIDALTGQVIDNGYGYEMGKGGGAEAAGGRKQKQDLTPVEQSEVDKLKNLMSAEKALEQAQRIIAIPPGFKQTESTLTQDYQFPDTKLWRFHWSAQDNTKELNVEIDAASGELVSYNNWDEMRYKQPSDQEPKFTLEQARQIAEQFIKKQQTQRFKEVKLGDSRVGDIIPLKGKMVPRSYNFTFVRLVNSIPFPNNGFNVQVDPYTGEVTSYRMTWWKLNFPSPAGVIDRDKAASLLLADGGLDLSYVNIYQKGPREPRMHLVYRLKDQTSFMLDARTGQRLNYNGEPIPPKSNNDISDIAGHPAENDIRLLMKANIIKSKDGKFYPDKNITKREALELLVASRGWYMDSSTMDDNKIVNAAINLGIIDSQAARGLDDELTRLQFAKLLINTLDYDGVAKLKDLYQLKIKDANQIPDELKGYVALSLGLGLQTGNQGWFLPNEKIPRGYAAASIVRLLKVQK